MKTSRWLRLFTLVCLPFSSLLQGEEAQQPVQTITPLTPFTGKVIRPKVRLRTKPLANKETIWRELQQGELLVVAAENGEYYAVEAPKGTKGYVYRSYVIDGVVEGLRVNVRLSPDFDAPTIAQVNTGDRVGGDILDNNRKWLAIDLPSNAYFYVMKDYIEKVGDASLYAKLEASREKAETLLKSAREESALEIAKNYNDINIAPIFAELDQVIALGNQPELAQQAVDLKKQLNEQLLLKKIDYYEKLGHASSDQLEKQNKKLKGELAEQEKRLATIQDQLEGGAKSAEGTNKMLAWQPIERRHFRNWTEERGHAHDDVNEELFYDDQHNQAQYLRGRLEAYDSSVRNKPGDYLLVNPTSGLPIAYLYSTKVQLQPYIGSQINIKAVERPNNHFAYPAYFVLEVE